MILQREITDKGLLSLWASIWCLQILWGNRLETEELHNKYGLRCHAKREDNLLWVAWVRKKMKCHERKKLIFLTLKPNK